MLNLTIANILQDDADPLRSTLEFFADELPTELCRTWRPVVDGEQLEPLPTSGYVVDTLQTGLHDALGPDSARDAIITTVNRGGDADTTGAVTGAIAGARFGASDLPDGWLAEIDEEAELRDLAGQLVGQ